MVPFNFIDDPGVNTSLTLGRNNSDSGSERSSKKFVTILGLIPTKHLLKFEKLLFRISRGNAVSKSKSLPDITDPHLIGIKREEKSALFLILPKTDKEIVEKNIRTVLETMDFKE